MIILSIPIPNPPVGGIPDFLIDPSTSSGQATGLFCQPQNPTSIAEKVDLLIKDGKIKEMLEKNAKSMVFEKYDWEIISRKMQAVFLKLLLLK